MKYGDLNLGQIEALVNKLGGMSKVRDILSGRKHVTLMSIKDLRIWSTLQLPNGTERDVVLVSAEQLGIQHEATHAEVCERAVACGLIPCPSEVVGVLCAPMHGTRPVAVVTNEPLDTVRDLDVCVLQVCDTPVSPVMVVEQDSERTWPSDHLWLFVLPRP